MNPLRERSPDGPGLWALTPMWAAVAVATAEAFTWLWDRWWVVGGVPLAPSAAVGLVAVAALARRGRLDASAVPIAVFLAVAVPLAAVYSSPQTPFALAAAAAGEEASYRLAVPVLVATVLRRCGLPQPVPAAAAMVAAALLFAYLPGHVAQFDSSPLGPAPWIGLAVLWVWMLWRGTSIAVVAAHHAAMNCVAFSTDAGAPQWVWTVSVVVPALTWMVLEGRRDRRLGLEGLLVDTGPVAVAADR